MERPVFRVGEGAISVDGFVIPAVWCGGEAGGGRGGGGGDAKAYFGRDEFSPFGLKMEILY